VCILVFMQAALFATKTVTHDISQEFVTGLMKGSIANVVSSKNNATTS
jgi:hypothetical protein